MLAYEGEALLGHWLPRALADIACGLCALGGGKLTRIEALRAWGLSHTAAMDEADEEAGRQQGLAAVANWIQED